MISHPAGRVKKSSSLFAYKENKENCNNNIQCPVPVAKIARIRDSLGDVHLQPEKVFASMNLDGKEERNLLDKILKQEYNWLVKKDYSPQILAHLLSKHSSTTNLLNQHQITPTLRTKMVDWMIEVLSSYKMSEQSFFRSVKYMDVFFKNTPRKLQVSDLHILGVVSMFTATKYEEIYPFKLNVIFDKICRKKFPRGQIIEMEQELLSSLDFQLQQVTTFDIMIHVLAELHLPLDKKAMKYLHKVSLYLGKMAMHSLELIQKTNNALAAALIFISLKTVEQVEPKLDADGYMDEIAEFTNIQISELLEISQLLLNLAKTFHKQYPNLTNLKKFNNAQYED